MSHRGYLPGEVYSGCSDRGPIRSDPHWGVCRRCPVRPSRQPILKPSLEPEPLPRLPCDVVRSDAVDYQAENCPRRALSTDSSSDHPPVSRGLRKRSRLQPGTDRAAGRRAPLGADGRRRFGESRHPARLRDSWRGRCPSHLITWRFAAARDRRSDDRRVHRQLSGYRHPRGGSNGLGGHAEGELHD